MSPGTYFRSQACVGSSLPPYKVGNLNSKLFLSEISKREKSLKRTLEGRISRKSYLNPGHYFQECLYFNYHINSFTPPQPPSPLPRPSCSLFLRIPAVRVLALEQRNGNIPLPSQREAGASEKTPLKGSRTPPPLPHHPLRRYPNSPTWGPALPLEKASRPISSLSALVALLTSVRAAGQEAGAAL